MTIQTNPLIICEACGESRNCTLHPRAEFPPDAARAYLRKHCDNEPDSCRFRYQAGILFDPKPLKGTHFD